MLSRFTKFSSRINHIFSLVALFGALLSAHFLSAKYELTIKHEPKMVTLTFAKDGHPSKPLVMKIDDKTHTFADRDYMHELLDIEEDGKAGIKITFKENKNQLSGVLYHDPKNGNHLDIKKLILDEDMGITTNGDLTFSKGVHAKKMLALTAKNINNNCTFEAKNIIFKGHSNATITNNALLKASEGISIKNGTLHNNGTIESIIGTFIDQTNIINDHAIKSNGVIDMRDGSLRNHGTIKTLSTIACYGPIVEQTGTLEAPTITINQPQHVFENKGIIASFDTTEINALNIVNNGTIAGALKNTNQGETLNNLCLLKAAMITNHGTMLGGQDFQLQATKEILNYGIWTTNKQFSATAPMIGNFKASMADKSQDVDQGIHGDGSLTVNCDNFTNALDAQCAIKGNIDLTARTKAYNAGLWHCDGSQNLTVGELEIEKDHILEMNGNGTITCKKADGKVLNKGLLAVNGNGIFNCSNFYNDGTTWTKGTMTFNVPGTFENRQTGRIESNGYLTVDAANFLNQAGFILAHNGGRINADTFKNEFILKDAGITRYNTWFCSGPDFVSKSKINSIEYVFHYPGPSWRMPCGVMTTTTNCLGYARFDGDRFSGGQLSLSPEWTEIHNYADSNPPILAASKGDLEINLHKNGLNDVGIIAAEKDILITTPSFDNNARPRQTVGRNNGGCASGDIERIYIPFDYRQFPSTIISNSGSVKVKVGNAECNVQNPGEQCNLNGFTNTGHIGAKQNIEFTAEGLAKFYNGLSQTSNMIVVQETAKSIEISFLPVINDPKNKYYLLPSKNQAVYQYESPFEDNTVKIDPRQLVYLDDGKPWDKMPKIILSPTLEADMMQQALAALIGRTLLPGQENIFEQLKHLHLDALKIGLTHGKLAPIGNDSLSLIQAPTNSTAIIATKQLAQYGTIIKTFGGAMTPQEFGNQVRTWSDGGHIPTLTQQQIESLPYAFPYAVRVPGSDTVMYKLHFPKELREKLWTQPGTMEAGGVIQTIGFNYAENTGVMLGNKIIIKAKTFTNRRRTTTHTETREQSGGWFGSDKTLHYEIETPESFSGKMAALTTIDIETDDDITNQGGLIMSVDVQMKSKNGSVINTYNKKTHIKDWDTGFWGKAFGDDSSALVLDFQPGMIIADGNLKMLAQSKIINTASSLFAQDAELNGYLGVLSETLASVNTARTSRSHSWFSFEGSETQEYQQGPAIMKFNTAHVTSEAGPYHSVGAQFKAKQATFDTQNNIFEPVTVTLHHKSSEGGARSFEVFGSKTNTQQTVLIPTVLQIDETTIKAAIDNTMQAVFMVGTDGGKAQFIHFVAGRDNVFKGAHQTISSETNGFSVGVSFFGSEAAKQLFNGRIKDAFIKLVEEEPLVRSLKALKHAQDWQNKTSESAHVAIEALRLLVNRIESAQAGQSLTSSIGQRYGITDAQGKFAPSLRFKCSLNHESASVDQTVPSLVHVKEIIVDSGRNIDILDGSKIKGDNVTLRGDALHMTSGTTIQKMMQTMIGYSASVAGKNLASVGMDFADGHAESTTHTNAEVEASNKLIVKVKDLMARGGVLLGDVVNLNAVNMCFESVQDITDQKMVSGSASVGVGYEGAPDVSGGFARNAHDSTITAARSKVRARTQLTVDATGKLKLVGANLEVESEKPGSYIRTPLLEVQDLNDHSHTHQLAAQIGTSLANSVKALTDFNLQRQRYAAKQHSMISHDIDLQADNIMGDKLVRNAEEQTEVIEDSRSHWRLVAPIIDSNKFSKAMKNLNEMFSNKKPFKYDDLKNSFEEMKNSSDQKAQEQSKGDKKSSFEQNGKDKTKKTDRTTIPGNDKEQQKPDTAQEDKSSKQNEATHKAKPKFVKEEATFKNNDGTEVKLEVFQLNNEKSKRQSTEKYTLQDIHEDPKTGKVSFLVKDGEKQFIALTASEKDLEQMARRIYAKENGLSFDAVKDQPFDKATSRRVILSKLIDYAPIIGGIIGGVVGCLGTGPGCVAGAMAGGSEGAEIGSIIAAGKKGYEAAYGYDLIADKKVEGGHRWLASAEALFGVCFSAFNIITESIEPFVHIMSETASFSIGQHISDMIDQHHNTEHRDNKHQEKH